VIHRLVSDHAKRVARSSTSPDAAPEAVARMPGFGVRSGSLAFARLRGPAADEPFERTGANGRELRLAFAMQKVVGSSPIIRSQKSCKAACLVVCAENAHCKMARFSAANASARAQHPRNAGREWWNLKSKRTAVPQFYRAASSLSCRYASRRRHGLIWRL
jgi:hypothetical protein